MLRTRSRPGLITRSGGGVAPFSPLDLSPALWLDASDTATITQAAGAVSQWNDKSGNGRHVTQGSASLQPTTNTRTMNGLNVIDFDGTSDLLNIPFSLYSLPNNSNTIFAVYSVDNTTIHHRILNATQANGSRLLTSIFYTGAKSDFSVINNTSATFVSMVIPKNTSAHIAGQLYDGIGGVASLTPFFDGVKAPSGAGGNAASVDAFSIGAQPLGYYYLDGVIAEIIIYNRLLSNAEANRVGAYAAAKWGVTWTGF